MARYFMIELGNAGSEVTVGKVNKDFVEFWVGEDSEDLVDHVKGLESDDEDEINEDSPPMFDDEDMPNAPFYDVTDYVHTTQSYTDATYMVEEIVLNDDAKIEEGILMSEDWNSAPYDVIDNFDYEATEPYIAAEREFYLEYTDDNQGAVPVLMSFTEQAGNLGRVLIVTDDEDFDPDLLAFSAIQTDLAGVINRVFYNGKEFPIDTNWAEPDGDYTEARVGYISPDYIGSDEEIAQEIKEYYEENFEEVA
jgi:hypothetical protein